MQINRYITYIKKNLIKLKKIKIGKI